jgi:hypothetical protein|tara:strand:- start:593 stop:775 length:183 start_codon:yes stop_codon:yes gene_type:complete
VIWLAEPPYSTVRCDSRNVDECITSGRLLGDRIKFTRSDAGRVNRMIVEAMIFRRLFEKR